MGAGRCSSPSNLAGKKISDILPDDVAGCADNITAKLPTPPKTDFDRCENDKEHGPCYPGTCRQDVISYFCICPKGFVATQTVPFTCKESGCSAGEYFNSTYGICQKCAKGSYTYVGNLVKCLKCPKFYTTKQEGSTSSQDCELSEHCPPGYFKLPSGVCIMCPDGSYQTDGYHSNCIKCDKNGTYSTGGPGATYHGFCGKNETIELESFKIEFGLPFDANYENKSSEEYAKLTNEIIQTLNNAMARVRYFRGFTVTKLSNGSVEADNKKLTNGSVAADIGKLSNGSAVVADMGNLYNGSVLADMEKLTNRSELTNRSVEADTGNLTNGSVVADMGNITINGSVVADMERIINGSDMGNLTNGSVVANMGNLTNGSLVGDIEKLSYGNVVADMGFTLMDHEFAESMFTSAFLHLNLSGYFPWPTRNFYGRKYPIFKITSVNPRKGPQYGGTNITLTGEFLYLNGPFQVHIGYLNCDVTFYNDTVAFCLSDPLQDYKLKNKSLNITISWQGKSIEALTLSSRFVYKSNPVVHSVVPRATILSGGTWINVTGSNIYSVSKVEMEVTVSLSGKTSQYLQQCKVINNTFFRCITPDLTNNVDETNRNPTDQCDLAQRNGIPNDEIHTNLTEEDIRNSEVFVNFVMDGAAKSMRSPEKLNVYPSPYFSLSTDVNKAFDYLPIWPCSHERIKIKGTNLALIDLLWPGAYEIRLGDLNTGDAKCKDIEIKDTEITCLPPKTEPFDSHADNTRVFVIVACQKINVFDLRYSSNPFSCNYMKIGFGIGFGVLIIIIGLIIYCVCRKQRHRDVSKQAVSRISSWVSSLRRSMTSGEPSQSNRGTDNQHGRGPAPSGAYIGTIVPSTSPEDTISLGDISHDMLIANNGNNKKNKDTTDGDGSYLDPEAEDSEIGYFPNSHRYTTEDQDYYNQHEDSAFGSGTLQYESYFKSHEMDYSKNPDRPMSQYVNSREAGVKLFKGFAGAHYHRGTKN